MTREETKYIEDRDVNFKVEQVVEEPSSPGLVLRGLLLKALVAVIAAWLLTFTIQQIRINQINVSLDEVQQELQQTKSIMNPDQQVVLTKLQNLEDMEQKFTDLCTQLENQPEECSIFKTNP